MKLFGFVIEPSRHLLGINDVLTIVPDFALRVEKYRNLAHKKQELAIQKDGKAVRLMKEAEEYSAQSEILGKEAKDMLSLVSKIEKAGNKYD
jgi:hypothetical protein